MATVARARMVTMENCILNLMMGYIKYFFLLTWKKEKIER